jgi:trk system potassium uptake protein
MKVIVCGAGMVGYNIARYLAAAGNDVTVIDQRPELVRRIGENLDLQAMTGFASHPDVLASAGAEDADMVIAVTAADEVNMVACQVAHSLFNVPTKIARVRHQSYLQPRWQDLFRREHMPIDVIISPELEVARAIARRLEVPGATEVTPFAEDRVRLIAARCGPDCPILDTPLRQLTFLFPDLHLTIEDVFGEGDKAAVRWVATGTHTGDLQGIAPTGKSMRATGISLFRVANGLVVEDTVEEDTMGVLRQLGVIPS